MPRGVYDRSALKKDKPAKAAKEAKAVKASAPKTGKRGRPPGSKNKISGDVAKTSVASVPGLGGIGQEYDAAKSVDGATSAGQHPLYLLHEVRTNIASLTAVAATFPDLPGVKTELAAHVGLLSELRQQAFGKKEEVKGTANGAYTTSVPMPPIPVVVPAIPQH